MSVSINSSHSFPFNQLVDLIKKLSKKEKQQLMDILRENAPDNIPEWQKQEVHKRIKKYEKNPGLLIDEKTALKMIKAM